MHSQEVQAVLPGHQDRLLEADSSEKPIISFINASSYQVTKSLLAILADSEDDFAQTGGDDEGAIRARNEGQVFVYLTTLICRNNRTEFETLFGFAKEEASEEQQQSIVGSLFNLLGSLRSFFGTN